MQHLIRVFVDDSICIHNFSIVMRLNTGVKLFTLSDYMRQSTHWSRSSYNATALMAPINYGRGFRGRIVVCHQIGMKLMDRYT